MGGVSEFSRRLIAGRCGEGDGEYALGAARSSDDSSEKLARRFRTNSFRITCSAGRRSRFDKPDKFWMIYSVRIDCDHHNRYDMFHLMIAKSTITGGRLKESRRFGFLLRDVTRLYVQRFERHAAALGLTLAQCRALMRLVDCEGVSQVQLAEMTELDPMALVRILDRMESEGWLERRRDPRDRRVRCVYLTSKAKPLLDDIRHLIDVTWEEAFAGIPKQKSDWVMELLDTVQRNLALDPPSSGAASMARRSAGGRMAARAGGKS